MNERSEFNQFRATRITFRQAFRLTGRDMQVMIDLRERRITEVLLDSGAKLIYTQDQFHIFSYASDGRDGWNAYCSVAPVNGDYVYHIGGHIHTICSQNNF